MQFFCQLSGFIWFFVGLLFVANASFNNLGYPLLSTFFNWGRATLGMIPFAYLGAQIGGPKGALVGMELALWRLALEPSSRRSGQSGAWRGSVRSCRPSGQALALEEAAMFNWFDLVRQAQTSAGLDALAQQFHLAGDQTQKAMAAFCRPSPWVFSTPSLQRPAACSSP